MNFLSILLALALEFVLGGSKAWRNADWSAKWAAWTISLGARFGWWRGWPAAITIVVVPLLAVSVGFAGLAALAPWLVHVAAVAVLLAMLGPHDLREEFAAHKRALTLAERPEDIHAPFVGAARGTDLGAPSGDAEYDATRVELAALALAADRAWFQPLFWYFVAGPVGAVAYRLCANLRYFEDADASIVDALARVREALEWVPARITALAMGLGGTLPPVLETMREVGVARWAVSGDLVARTALAAADNGRIREVISGDARIYRLNQMFALIKRALIAWLALMAAAALLIA